MAIGLTALLVLLWPLFFAGLGRVPLFSVGEPREALEVTDAIDHGAWILPLRNGTEMPSKPPLYHWLADLTALGFGRVDELTVRLPSAILATLTVLAVVWFGARRWDAAAGLYGGFILATSLDFIHFAREARVDMTLACCLTAAWMAFDRAVASPFAPPLMLWAFYLSMGLAALAKGPVGLAQPILLALAYLTVRGELRRLRNFRIVPGLALAIAIPAAWYVMAVIEGGMPFVRKQIMRENVLHFLGTERTSLNESHPIYYYGSAFIAGLLPWSLFLVPLAVYLIQIRRRPERRPYDLPLLWIGIVIAFYTVAASKRSLYILAAYPAAAVALGAWWSRLQRQRDALSAPLRWLLYAGVAAAVGIAAAVLLSVLAQAIGLDTLEWIRPLLHRKDQMNLPLVREAVSTHRLTAFLWASALAASAALLFAGARRRGWRLVFAALVLAVTATTVAVGHAFTPILGRDRTYKPFMAETLRLVGDSDRLFFYRRFDYGAVFYARRHIPVTQQLPDSPAWLILADHELNSLPVADRARLTVVTRSEGTGPEGSDRYVLVWVAPSQSGTGTGTGTGTGGG
jgi:4-amino-4-deoxy-L-arabinose transferase-like glycosyltransferase